MKEETKVYCEAEQEAKMPVPHPESATSGSVAARETQQILKDNREAKKEHAMGLEARGLSREAITRLLHLETDR